MSTRLLRAGLPGLALALAPLGGGVAHEIVGNRFFPATLGIEDPGANDELSLPTVSNFKTGDDPSFKKRDISAEFSKRITEAFAGPFGYAIRGRRSTSSFGVDPDSGELTADTEFHPKVLNWGGTIQYSMPYLKSAVVDLGLPDFINHLIPIVEATLQTPVSNTFTSGTMTTGTINPSFLWVGNKFQVGVEALIPITRQSGTNVGVIAQLHFYLDDIDPRGIGKPIFGDAVQPASPFPRN